LGACGLFGVVVSYFGWFYLILVDRGLFYLLVGSYVSFLDIVSYFGWEWVILGGSALFWVVVAYSGFLCLNFGCLCLIWGRLGFL